MNPNPTDIITLDVGGTKFKTTRSTLSNKETINGEKQPHFLSMLIENTPDDGEEKEIFIDRNPKYFQFFLDYLRSGCRFPLTIAPPECVIKLFPNSNDIYIFHAQFREFMYETMFYGFKQLTETIPPQKVAHLAELNVYGKYEKDPHRLTGLYRKTICYLNWNQVQNNHIKDLVCGNQGDCYVKLRLYYDKEEKNLYFNLTRNDFARGIDCWQVSWNSYVVSLLSHENHGIIQTSELCSHDGPHSKQSRISVEDSMVEFGMILLAIEY